jgi:hypothetical protein
VGLRSFLPVRARTIIPMEIRIDPDHPPHTQVDRRKALAQLRWSSGDTASGKTPHIRKTPRRTSTKKTIKSCPDCGAAALVRQRRDEPGRRFGTMVLIADVKFSPC